MRTLAPCGAVFVTDRLRQKKNAVAPNGATAFLAQREGYAARGKVGSNRSA